MNHERYLLSHGKQYPNEPYLIMLTKPLYGFKKVYTRYGRHAIASLIIPAGATVHCGGYDKLKRGYGVTANPYLWHSGHDRPRELPNDYSRLPRREAARLHLPTECGIRQMVKLRASEAKVHSIVGIGAANGKVHRTAYASFDTSFIYKVGATVKPVKGFDLEPDECASGIHFFLCVDEAAAYE